MKLYSENEHYKLYQGSMLDMLEVIKPNSIDSVITDPPYELNFMGKGWDNAGISFQPDTWKKCYEVLKPGGYLLAFGGSRTFHRIACAIEDAGFEIRDTIMWLYGAGFPKSMNIGKQLEKRLKDEKTKQKTEHDLRLMWERDLQKTKRNEKKQDEVLQSQLQEQSLQGTMYGEKSKESNLREEQSSMERWNNIQKTERELQRCKICKMSKRISIDGEERWICNRTQISDGKTLREMFEQSGSCSSYRPQSEQQQDRELNVIQEQCRTQESREIIEYWNKFGIALKPSFEPIIVARKPFKGSLVDNVIEYGVGGINIDECRVEANDKVKMNIRDTSSCSDGWNRPWMEDKEKDKKRQEIAIEKANNLGRFPANTMLTYDETDFDTTSWLRYFYCAKASKKDRDEGLDDFEEKPKTLTENKGRTFNDRCAICGKKFIGSPETICHCENPITDKSKSAMSKNTHPTVKPTDLMQYLVRLVSPKGSTILDCFNGSGSTGKAVMYENKERDANYKYIGIELTEEYLPIAKARIEYVCNLEHEVDNQTNIFDFIEE